MIKSHIKILAITFAILWPLCVQSANKPAAEDAEEIVDPAEIIRLDATAILPKELLSDEGYKIDSNVVIFRSRAFYELDIDGEREVVVSTRRLLERIDELNAIKKLQAMKKTTVYKEAVKGAAASPFRFAKNVVKSPGKTLSRAARGIGSFIADVGYSIVSDDPSQENVAKTAVGFANAKRAFAYELGVNPYTNFEDLDNELNDVSWAAVGGGLTMSAGFKAVGGTPGTLLQGTKIAEGMRKLVRDKSPRQLQNINFDKLAAMGVEEYLAEVLLDNYNYDPETETRLIGALHSMKGVTHRPLFVQRAALADTPANARLLRDWAEMFAAYHTQIGPAKSIAVFDTAPFLILDNAVAAGLFPTDYAHLGGGGVDRLREVAEKIEEAGFSLGPFWVTGPIYPQAEKDSLAMGWTEVRSRAETVLYRN